MPIDYEKARQRIIEAFCGGILRQYGPRRIEIEEHEVERPGPQYWDKNEQWVDPNGVPRQGRFKRKPSQRLKQKVQVPKGVPELELRQYAEGMVDAFLEVIRILEEDSHADRPTHARGG